MRKQAFIKDAICLANDGWLQGWHEHNGGNISYRMRKTEVHAVRKVFHPGPWQTLPQAVPNLAKEHLLITAAGCQFRQLARSPKECLGIIELDRSGERYRCCWGFQGGGHPTSELAMHLMAQEMRVRVTQGKSRVLYHAHPAHVIALTAVMPQDDARLTAALWSAMCECALVIPRGVGVVGWEVPGTLEIAQASAGALAEHDVVIWAHHGVFCAASTMDEAFGKMHTIEKAASILVHIRAMHPKENAIEQRITRANVEALAQVHRLDLDQDAVLAMDA